MQRLSWGAMTTLSLAVAAYAAFHVVTRFAYLPPAVANNGFGSPWGLRLHIGASAIALALGPFQFLRNLRTRAPSLHRWSGRLYVAACFVGGAAGGAIAMFSASGAAAGAGFLALAALWLLFTGLALSAAPRRDFIAHERWMVRSFALTFAAVTLRFYLPVGVLLSHGAFAQPYTIIAWMCWVPNLLFAEGLLATRSRRSFKTET